MGVARPVCKIAGRSGVLLNKVPFVCHGGEEEMGKGVCMVNDIALLGQ